MDESLGDLLRRYRLRAQLTQAALAERAGLSEQAVSLLERGIRKRPRRETLRLLGEALELDAEELGLFTAASHRTPRSAARDTPVREPSTDPGQIAAESTGGDQVPVPRQLPPTIADFVGRAEELAALHKLLAQVETSPGGVTTVAVTGMAGVGKTTLAIHAAQLSAEHYPDAHLYLDLRGYGPDEPLTVADALGQFLRSLGLEDSSIPVGVDERSALLRSQLAGRRVLILLDNANGAGQVTPLLPGGPGAAVIVTSRHDLSPLPGFRQIILSPMPESDSLKLMTRISGRVTDHGEAARTVVQFTGHLPLAVRLIGARLAARPHWRMDYLADRLKDERRRLDQFGTGESGVRASIAGTVEFLAGSHDELDRQAAEALAYLGLLGSSQVRLLTACHLLDETADRVEQLLERLVDLNLLVSIAPGQYQLHDLIQAFASELCEGSLTARDSEEALSRILRFYTAVGWACQRLAYPDNPRLQLASPFSGLLPPFTGATDSLNWIDSQWASIAAVVQRVRTRPRPRRLVPELTLSLFGYFAVRYRWSEMRQVLTVGIEASDGSESGRLAAWIEHDLGIPDVEHNIAEPAIIHFQRSLAMFESIADPAGEARCCASLSLVMRQKGRLEEGLEFATRALAASRRAGDLTLQGTSYMALGGLYADRGDSGPAADSFERALCLSGELGHARVSARRYAIAGEAFLRSGNHGQAVEWLATARTLLEASGEDTAVAETWGNLATGYLALADYSSAQTCIELGQRLARSLGSVFQEARILIVRGQLAERLGDVEAARSDWRKAAGMLRPLSPQIEAVARRLLEKSEAQGPLAANGESSH